MLIFVSKKHPRGGKSQFDILTEFGYYITYDVIGYLPGAMIKIYHNNKFRLGLVIGNTDNNVVIYG